MNIYYNPKLKALSRELRKKSTLSEVLLWNVLKGMKIKDYQFMRQKPIGDYIVDFSCSKLKLVIEIDGISHNDKGESDTIRQQKLESLGLSVLRFYEWNVKKKMFKTYCLMSRCDLPLCIQLSRKNEKSLQCSSFLLSFPRKKGRQFPINYQPIISREGNATA